MKSKVKNKDFLPIFEDPKNPPDQYTREGFVEIVEIEISIKKEKSKWTKDE